MGLMLCWVLQHYANVQDTDTKGSEQSEGGCSNGVLCPNENAKL